MLNIETEEIIVSRSNYRIFDDKLEILGNKRNKKMKHQSFESNALNR